MAFRYNLCATKWEFPGCPVAPGNEDWDRKLYLLPFASCDMDQIVESMNKCLDAAELLHHFTDDKQLAGNHLYRDLCYMCLVFWRFDAFKNAEFTIIKSNN